MPILINVEMPSLDAHRRVYAPADGLSFLQAPGQLCREAIDALTTYLTTQSATNLAAS